MGGLFALLEMEHIVVCRYGTCRVICPTGDGAHSGVSCVHMGHVVLHGGLVCGLLLGGSLLICRCWWLDKYSARRCWLKADPHEPQRPHTLLAIFVSL